ncbi:cobalamin biosynthesis protein [Streptomyces sp. MT29]|nr:cobalamin biosynthesis protein [Streptomyces sp. MT29]
MRADRVFAYAASPGLIADAALGDPHRGHPVAGFGRAAARVESLLWRDDRGRGALHTLLCAGGAVGAATLAARAVRGRSALAVAMTAATTWSVVGGTSLGREAAPSGARWPPVTWRWPGSGCRTCAGVIRTPWTGRNIARAVVESVAENTSDAVVGALVWGAIGGVPGLAGFRAVNTLDAMVGHKSPHYRRYGWASARLDDLAGWPGAR